MSEEVAENGIVSPKCVGVPRDHVQPLDEWIAENRGNYTRDIHTLVLAAKYNDVEVAERYIRCQNTVADLEVTSNACVKPNRPIVIAATPLWMASACGNLEMVRYLIGQGAEVNHATKTGSTPLRGACFYGHLEVVRFLHANSACLNTANQWGNTPLMIAAYRKHLHVVRFLLVNGADMFAQSIQGEERGNNALHEACAGGDLQITQLLYQSSVPYCHNEHGMTPAIIAASEGMIPPMEFFLNNGVCSGHEAVNALELAGSAVVMRGHLLCSSQQMFLSTPFFKRAFQILEERGDFTRSPPAPEPIAPYCNIVPVTRVTELAEVTTIAVRNAMYCLMVRERVTSKQHFHTANDTRYSALLYQAVGDTCLGLELALYNLSLNAISRPGSQCFGDSLAISISFIEKETCHFISGRFNIASFAKVALEGVKRLYSENMLEEFDEIVPEEREEKIIVSVLNLLAVWGHFSQDNVDKWEECLEFTRELIQLPISATFLTHGSNLLHFVCHFPTEPIKEKVHQYELGSFLNYRHIVARLLIETYCDPNHLDTFYNTSLHIAIRSISRCHNNVPLSICLVVRELIVNGVHLDTRNVADCAINWDTLEYAAFTGGFVPLFNSIKILPLKCLSARTVATSGHNFHTLEKVLPRIIFDFVQIHSKYK